jgi:hypothetical protein
LTIGCFLEDDRRKIEYMHVEIIIFIKMKKSDPGHFSGVKMIIGSTNSSPSLLPRCPFLPPSCAYYIFCFSSYILFIIVSITTGYSTHYPDEKKLDFSTN